MNRSVKDLRELICVSRLSYRAEEDDDQLGSSNSDEDFGLSSSHLPVSAPKLPKRKNKDLSPLEKEEKLVSPPLSAGSSGRGSPLPPIIRKSPVTSPDSSGQGSPVNCVETCARPRKSKPTRTDFDDLLIYMDSTVISDWLARVNDAVKDLTAWLHNGNNFVHFAHFFLSEIAASKRRELVQLEFSIVMEEVSFSFKAGTDCRQVTARDLDTFVSAVLWEYPHRFSDSECGKSFLGILVCLCSGRKDNYRTLLSNVKCSTTNKQFVQQILATRAFAIVSLCSGIVKFYKQVSAQETCDSTPRKEALSSKDIDEMVTEFAFQAVRKGLVDVLEYLLQSYSQNPQSMRAKDGKTLLFTAVICTQGEVLRYLLKLKPKLDVDEAAESGNTPLHAAVNTGNVVMVKMLIEAGASLDKWNPECEGATPLHLAIMSGNTDIVTLLLTAGCQIDVKMGVPATVTPLQLASDLGLDEITGLLSGFSVQR